MATRINTRLCDMNKARLKEIRSELKYSHGSFICSIGDHAIFSASVGWSDVTFMYAKKCKYGIASGVRIYEEYTVGMRLYYLNDVFARLMGYKDLSDMKAHLPSIQYHRRFISLKAIDRATIRSRRKRERSGGTAKSIRNTTPVFNNLKD